MLNVAIPAENYMLLIDLKNKAMYEDSGGIEGSVPLIGTSTGTM